MPKTKKIPPGGRVVTRAELTFFANACEAMMNAKVAQMEERLRADMLVILNRPPMLVTAETDLVGGFESVPTDSEGAE